MPDPPVQPESEESGSKWVGWTITAVLLLMFAGIAFVGLRSTERITVPSLSGWTEAEAVAELSKIGLVTEVEPAENPGDAQLGTVVAQDPEPGVGLRPGGTVTIEVVGAER